VEGDRWLVTLGGLHGEQPPTDEAGYLDYARGLAVPDVYQAIAAAEPLTPIATHNFPANRRRHYERLEIFPERLLVMGDAFCSFNPIYGQGMTVSALEAMALDSIMRDSLTASDGLAGLHGRFHKTISTIVDSPWRLTTGEDFRHAEALGKRPRGTTLLHWYTGRMHERCAHDAALALAFYRVMHMIDPPSRLFRPSTMARVLGPRWSPAARDDRMRPITWRCQPGSRS
jgi:2-polyprenyl-6-methoxyphenol hydroxylase-like FAD-dependent oxidoreductase